MMNTLFGFPVNIVSGQTAQQNSYSAAAQPMLGQMLGMAGQYNQNQQYSGQHAANMLAQQQAAFNAAMTAQQHQWMINGRTMTFDDFLDEVAPGDDNPMRTFLILKYKK